MYRPHKNQILFSRIIIKKFLFKLFVDNRLMSIIASPALGVTIPSLVGLYYLILSLRGDEWAIIKNYSGIHELILIVIVSANILILFLKGMSQVMQGKIQTKYDAIILASMTFINEVVESKKNRFHENAKNILPKSDIFKKITQPEKQLELLSIGTKRLLRDAFGIDSKNIEITIIQGCESEGRWWYMLKTEGQRQHTKAKDIVEGKSTARFCLQTGDSIFVPDIRKGQEQNAFLPSERSSKSTIGSIYCKPIRVNVGTKKYTYVFTVCVYGEQICTPYDVKECRASERLLDEVAVRVELELCLHSMKCFKEKGGV